MPIKAIASAVPGTVEDAAAIAAATGANVDFIIDKVGIRERHVLAADETGVDLAEAACRRLFEATGLAPSEVDLLVFVTQTPDYPIPHNSALLAARLDLSPRLAAFDISLGCSGFVYALSVVEHFLAGEELDTALLVTCDPYSKIIAAEDKATNAVFGDAATATLVHRTDGLLKAGRCDYGTDGGGYRALIREAGGAKNPLIDGPDEPAPQYERNSLRLQMRGRDVYDFVMTRVPESVERCLARNGLSLDRIDRFALHQGSQHMLRSLAGRIGAPDDKVLYNIDRYGNTVSSTIPMLLEEELSKDGASSRRILISGFGVGLSWATNVLSIGHHD